MNTPAKYPHKAIQFLWQIHEKISSWSAHLIGPMVFNFGIKEPSWNMRTEEFVNFPVGTVGKALGDFFKNNRLQPISGAESHDLYHVLFGYSASFKDEVALQFFLRGNGKNSIASFGTSIGAWILLPWQWSYLRNSYKLGKKCNDISTLDLKSILFKEVDEVRALLFEQSKTTNK